jgi:hypothetical protein
MRTGSLSGFNANLMYAADGERDRDSDRGRQRQTENVLAVLSYDYDAYLFRPFGMGEKAGLTSDSHRLIQTF